MMDRRVYWVWLQQALGYAANVPECVRSGSGALGIYERVKYDSSEFSRGKIEHLLDKDLSASQDILSLCDERGYRVLTFDDSDYPSALRDIINPPLVLYVNGDIDFNSKVMIGIVGARKASRYSVQVVSKLSYSLAKGGFTVVSGGALGVDSAAHTGAVLAHGTTIAVLGCGLDYNYLRANRTLRDSISKNGAVISEFPPQYPAGVSTFPIRNRIISGLSLGIVVAQANLHSGSLITAKHAQEQGRDIFAIPGGIYNTSFEGVNQLLRDGAKPVYGVQDIFEEYVHRFPDKLNLQKASENGVGVEQMIDVAADTVSVKKHDSKEDVDFSPENYPANLSPKAQLVYDTLSFGELHVNDICLKTSLSLGEVLGELTLLELDGYIRALPGKRYMQNR